MTFHPHYGSRPSFCYPGLDPTISGPWACPAFWAKNLTRRFYLYLPKMGQPKCFMGWYQWEYSQQLPPNSLIRAYGLREGNYLIFGLGLWRAVASTQK
jgi:hypothetical protein